MIGTLQSLNQYRPSGIASVTPRHRLDHRNTDRTTGRRFIARSLALLGGVLFGIAASASEFDPPIECRSCDSWNQPQDAFRIHGNTWYVGVAGLSAILIDTGDGLILLDGGLPQSAQPIAQSIESIGFSVADIRTIGLSHAHFDHAGGIAALQRLSGAEVIASPHAAKTLKAGRLVNDDPQFAFCYANTGFPAVEKVRIVRDGDTVALGDVNLTVVFTPGHTPGGTTFTWKSCEAGDCKAVVYADSLTPVTAPGFRFTGVPADVLRESVEKVAALDCDVFLSPHPFFFDMAEKLERVGDSNPFVDEEGCAEYAYAGLGALEQRLSKEASDTGSAAEP